MQCPNCGETMESMLVRYTVHQTCPSCSLTGDTECVAAVAKLRADWQERGDRIAELTREVEREKTRADEAYKDSNAWLRKLEECEREVARLKTPGVVLEMAEALMRSTDAADVCLASGWVEVDGKPYGSLPDAYAKRAKEAW